MNILYLGPKSSLMKWIEDQNDDDQVFHYNDEIYNDVILIDIDFVISYGYRHIIKKEVIDRFPSKIINLHISLLPWNRGADPNYWSWIDNTPKGVTIHQIDKGIDTGDILAQVEVPMGLDETLASSYERLKIGMEDLFKAAWKNIRRGKTIPQKQKGVGSYHRIKDRPVDFPPFSIPVKELITKKR